MHWMGRYLIKEVTYGGAVQLVNLNGKLFPGKVNGTQLKPYISGMTICLAAKSLAYSGSVCLRPHSDPSNVGRSLREDLHTDRVTRG